MKIKNLGLCEYLPTVEAMTQFTLARQAHTEDELWLLEHCPVFTQGKAGKAEHLLSNPQDIPVVKADRGGQITYHGPGQLIAYTLIDLKRLHLGVRELVHLLENSVIDTLAEFDITARGDAKAPGVYVKNKKIASLGLRVRNGAVYHGIGLNVNMDLSPFSYINPCGYAGLEMTQISEFVDTSPTIQVIGNKLTHHLNKHLLLRHTKPE